MTEPQTPKGPEPSSPSSQQDRGETTVALRPESTASAESSHPPLPQPGVPAALGPDAGVGDPTDGRKPYEWKSRYPDEATPIIRQESCFSVGVLLLALLLILFTWLGYPAKVLGVDGVKAASLQKYCYYAFSGLLGGAVFGVKYLYRVVARGYWHVDRRLWRFMSPFVAMAVAFAMGALIEANYLSARTPISGAATIGLGFLVGHFADQAVAKLHELANVLFGAVAKTSESQSRPPKQSG